MCSSLDCSALVDGTSVTSTFYLARGEIHQGYDAARWLPEETVEVWISAVKRRAGDLTVGTICDIGSGTGRFAGALAEGFSALVYAIEPSAKMLEVARAKWAANATARGEVRFLCAAAEAIPLPDDSSDMVFMSQVYHHLEDPDRALGEVRRILRPGGIVAIRQATRENIESVILFKFFPAARELEYHRLPPRRGVIEALMHAGFVDPGFETITQVFSATHEEYLEKVGRRGLSALRMISDEEFQRGLERLRSYCVPRSREGPVTESFDLIWARRPEGN